MKGTYGNAIGSRYPIVATRDVHLRGGSEVGFPAGTQKLNGEVAKEGELHRIVRGLAIVELELGGVGNATPPLPSSRFAVGCTHLDHISRKQRLVQLAHVAEEMAATAATVPTMVLGDLNTLTRSDYTDAQWAGLEGRAVDNGWAAPEAGGLDVLKAAGYADAFDHAASASEQRMTAPTEGPVYRIDYVLPHDRWLEHYDVASAAVATDVPHSDHFPCVVDFARRATDSGDGETRSQL